MHSTNQTNDKCDIQSCSGATHEQNRDDRDQFVSINWANIVEDKKNNFQMKSNVMYSSHHTAFDIDSIMFYGSRDFSKNGGITIQAYNLSDQARWSF